ncbi:hypothetical protein L1887_33759 [Cichorium endivia]|nr:hypothetical protein L1887_33759 [Cichorium endivia]
MAVPVEEVVEEVAALSTFTLDRPSFKKSYEKLKMAMAMEVRHLALHTNHYQPLVWSSLHRSHHEFDRDVEQGIIDCHQFWFMVGKVKTNIDKFTWVVVLSRVDDTTTLQLKLTMGTRHTVKSYKRPFSLKNPGKWATAKWVWSV